MLVLSRKPGETLTIDGNIIVKVVKVNGNRVKLGIEAPNDVHVLRGEVVNFDDQAMKSAATSFTLTHDRSLPASLIS